MNLVHPQPKPDNDEWRPNVPKITTSRLPRMKKDFSAARAAYWCREREIKKIATVSGKRIRELLGTLEGLLGCPKKAQKWLDTRFPAFLYLTPRQLIESGHLRKVCHYIEVQGVHL
jgi:hypothetical protein